MYSTTPKIATGLGALLLMSVASVAVASSHREAPGITQTPKIDGTDFYMFRSYEPDRAGYVTMIANYQPIQAPYGGPNYFTMDSNAVYEIHVDNDGDAVEDLTFQFKFDNTLRGGGQTLSVDGQNVAIPLRQSGPITPGDQGAQNELETYTVNMITGDRRSGKAAALSVAGNASSTVFTKPIDNIGTKTLPDYAGYANRYIYDTAIPDCDAPGRVFVGQRAEAFAVNLGPVFDLINLVPIQGDQGEDSDYAVYDTATPFAGGITQDRANDDLVGKANVTSIAIEVPISCLTGDGNGVIGAWTTSSLPQAQLEDPSPSYEGTSVFGGAYVQQSRLSNPLVNEVVIGLPDKDLFNAAEPTQDSALALYVTNPTLPELIELLFGGVAGLPEELAPNNFPRNDLVTAFLTGFPGVNQLATVTPSEMLRLNTALPVTPRDQQNPFGLVAEDLGGFPNGRRPGDDTVDIALRVVMGALCYDLPLATELGVEGAQEDTDSDFVNLGLCSPEDAPVGNAAFTDGAPILASELQNAFPYLNTPLPGAS